MTYEPPDVVIADTSCLIILTKIGELDLLRLLYPKIVITEEVASEFGPPIPGWIEERTTTVESKLKFAFLDLDPGEKSALALAATTPRSLLILDDREARAAAQKLGMRFTGTLGILLKAKECGLVDAISPLLDKIQRTNFRVSPKLARIILEQANEL